MKNEPTSLQSTFHFNPFGGLKESEIVDVIVPSINLDLLIESLNSSSEIIIELVGKKGRGKTLHLRYLKLIFPDCPIFFLNKNFIAKDALLQHKSDIILIDSIHHLNFLDRIKLFKTRKKIILTTHTSRKWEYRMARKPFEIFRFKGIEQSTLKDIIYNRLKIASNHQESLTDISDEKI